MVTIDNAPQTESITSQPSESTKTPVARRRRWWPPMLAGLAALIGLSLLWPAGRHQWAISFIRQPTPYTTLSFRDAAGLPRNIETGAPVHLTFTVANHEGRRLEYPYVLSSLNLSGAPDKTVLSRATLAVPSGAERTRSVTVRPACKASSCEVQVALPGHPETIDVVLNVHQSQEVNK